MMGGDSQEERGLIPRICMNLFRRLDEDLLQPNKVEVSYYEIYNEQAYDLLKTPVNAFDNHNKELKAPLSLKEDVAILQINFYLPLRTIFVLQPYVCTP